MPLSQFDLTNRIALVTGATKGIGQAIARALANAGATVHIHGHEAGDYESIASLGGRYFHADFENPDEVDQLIVDFRAAEDRLDILVNNAGIELGAPLDRLDPRIVERTLAVNLHAPIRLTRGLLPLLRRSRHASVINITSIHESVPMYANTAYSASKAALAMVTKNLAIELGPDAIRVNAIAPGVIETDINRDVLDRVGRPNFAEWIPLGRVGTVDDIVGPAIFLASDAAKYVSGASLVVDGAYSHHLVRYRTEDQVPAATIEDLAGETK